MAAADIMTATPALHKDLVIFAAFDGKYGGFQRAMARALDLRREVRNCGRRGGDRRSRAGRQPGYDLIALDASMGKELWKHYYWFSWIIAALGRDGATTRIFRRLERLCDQPCGLGAALEDSRARMVVAAHRRDRGSGHRRDWGAGAFPGPRAGSLVALDRATGTIRWIYRDPPTEEIPEGEEGLGFRRVARDCGWSGVRRGSERQGRCHRIEVNPRRNVRLLRRAGRRRVGRWSVGGRRSIGRRWRLGGRRRSLGGRGGGLGGHLRLLWRSPQAASNAATAHSGIKYLSLIGAPGCGEDPHCT